MENIDKMVGFLAEADAIKAKKYGNGTPEFMNASTESIGQVVLLNAILDELVKLNTKEETPEKPKLKAKG